MLISGRLRNSCGLFADSSPDEFPLCKSASPGTHIAKIAIVWDMDKRSVLRDVMLDTGTTQSELSRLSGVRQPSISQFLSGRVELSDDQLDRLLSCMGYRLEVVRRPVVPQLNRSERRSWQLHRRLSTHLDRTSLEEWRPIIERNLKRLTEQVTGQPHERNLDRWRELVDRGDLPRLHRVLTGLDRDSIEMREVSPLSGLLSQEERTEVLQGVA
jgi:transcriptional regulator with XRE-family HTH domain